MNTKKHAQSGFLDSRALIILLLCAVASLVLVASLLGFARAEASAKVSYRTLTFAEHVLFAHSKTALAGFNPERTGRKYMNQDEPAKRPPFSAKGEFSQ